MPRNKKESLVFTLMMCTLMVLVMTFYNVIRIHGLNDAVIFNTLLGFPLAFVIAFLADWFLVGPIAKSIAFKFLKEDDSMIKKAMTISTCMVLGMVLIMSLFGAIMGHGFSSGLLGAWLINMPFNLLVALPLQLLLVGPLVRMTFGKIYLR